MTATHPDFAAAAAQARFELPVCRDCGRVQYPPQETCSSCLSAHLEWRVEAGHGELLSETNLAHSLDPYFKQRLPWRTGLVRLDSGPVALAHVHAACEPAPSRVRVGARIDHRGRAVLIAFPVDNVARMRDDRKLRAMIGRRKPRPGKAKARKTKSRSSARKHR